MAEKELANKRLNMSFTEEDRRILAELRRHVEVLSGGVKISYASLIRTIIRQSAAAVGIRTE